MMTWMRTIVLAFLALCATIDVARGNLYDADTELVFMLLIIIWQHVANIEHRLTFLGASLIARRKTNDVS